MKVWDLFPFFNEKELLHLRIAELDPVVTDYGFSELPRTFTDLPKGVWLHYNWPIYQHDGHRFHAYQYQAIPSGPHPTVDWFQRKSLGDLLVSAEPDDIVMISDVDEIPNRDVVRRLIAAGIDEPLTLQSRLYYHRVDLFDPSGPWSGTIIMPRRFITEEMNPQEWRHKRCVLPQIPDAGWHFSWLGNEEAIAHKLLAVDIERDSDGQMRNPGQDLGFLRKCYETGADLFGRREHDKVQVPIIPGVNQPHEILPWLAKYPQYAGRVPGLTGELWEVKVEE